MEEFVDFYDKQKLKDYYNKNRNEILNGLEDLRKENDNFFRRLIIEENDLLYNILNLFRNSNEINSKEKVIRLDKLYKINKSLESIFFNNYEIRNKINLIKSLENED